VVVVGFNCDDISCELARRGVRRGAAQSSAYGNEENLTSVLDQRQFYSFLIVSAAIGGLQVN